MAGSELRAAARGPQRCGEAAGPRVAPQTRRRSGRALMRPCRHPCAGLLRRRRHAGARAPLPGHSCCLQQRFSAEGSAGRPVLDAFRCGSDSRLARGAACRAEPAIWLCRDRLRPLHWRRGTRGPLTPRSGPSLARTLRLSGEGCGCGSRTRMASRTQSTALWSRSTARRVLSRRSLWNGTATWAASACSSPAWRAPNGWETMRLRTSWRISKSCGRSHSRVPRRPGQRRSRFPWST
mmetsp:Transcript_81361/g.242492  ORF Transcript_81361/g.242492 Transcript_81361/m.242492 type:complete len:237 (+) Transcript_81361:54-764(+)